MQKILIWIIPLLFLSGCRSWDEQEVFVKKHGALTAFECDQSGFLIKTAYLGGGTIAKTLVVDNTGTPVRCSNDVATNTKN